MGTRIVGLDIGKDTIRAVEVENADKARPTVVRCMEVVLPDGAVRSGEVREVNTVAAAIKKMWTTGGFKSKDVVLGMGNQRVLVRDLTVPKAGIAQIRESLPFQVQEMLPVPIADALLDFYPVSEGEGENGPVLHGLLVAAIKNSVLPNVNAVRQAGLRVAQVDLIPFAMARVLGGGSASDEVVALIDVGANTTTVVVTSGGIPQFVRMIPVGGEDLTRSIATDVELSPQDAEAAKRTRGLSSAPVATARERAIATIIHASIGELLNSLRNTLNYYGNTRQTDPVGSIVLSGGGSQMSGFRQALGEFTRLPVNQADPLAAFEISAQAHKAADVDPASLTVALGLALGSVA